MQCNRLVRRNVCGTRNAFDSALALRIFFGTTSPSKRIASFKDEHHDAETPLPLEGNASSEPNIGRDSPSQSVRQPRKRKQSRNRQKECDHVHSPGQMAQSSARTTPQQNNQTSENTRPLIRKTRIFRKSPFTIDVSQSTQRPEVSGSGPDTNVQQEPLIEEIRPWQRRLLYIRDEVKSYTTATAKRQARIGLETMRERMDYEPMIIWPRLQQDCEDVPAPWAVSRAKARGQRPGDVLCLEMQAFQRYMQITPTEHIAREAVVNEVTTLIEQTLDSHATGRTGYELHGSQKTGLALPGSDIDIRLFELAEGREIHFDPQKLSRRMQILVKALHHSDSFVHPQFRFATFPIITCQHRESGITVQIVSHFDTKPQQQVIAKYLTDIPHLKLIHTIMRTFLAVRGLLDVYHGGLGSYGTLASILAVLQHPSPNRKERDEWASLRDYLEFYSILDTTKHSVAVHPRPRFLKHDKDPLYTNYSKAALRRGDPVRSGQWLIGQRALLQPYLLCLQDPVDPCNDLGRRAHGIKRILKTISNRRRVLFGQLAKYRTDQFAPIENSFADSLLLPLLGRCHEMYDEPRRKLRDFGRRVAEEKGIKIDEDDKGNGDDVSRVD